ncbi:MAG: EamA family transporter [Candidatus Thermoplasmatota archaeon]
MEAWFYLSISVALFWGLSGIFAKYSTAKLGVARVALVIAGVEGVMYSIAYLLWRDTSVDISLWEGVLAASSCIIGITGYLCYFESILEGQVAIVGTISAAYPALVVVGAMLMLSEGLSAAQAIGVVAIIGGVMALSYEPDPGAAHSLSRRSLTFAFLAFFAWGAWSLTSKVAVDAVTAGNLFGFYVISSLTAPVLYAWARRVRPAHFKGEDPTKTAWLMGGVALFLNVVGAFSYTYALEGGNASLVVPVTSAYPIVTALLAVAVLKERVRWPQAVALVVVVAGLVMIGITL